VWGDTTLKENEKVQSFSTTNVLKAEARAKENMVVKDAYVEAYSKVRSAFPKRRRVAMSDLGRAIEFESGKDSVNEALEYKENPSTMKIQTDENVEDANLHDVLPLMVQPRRTWRPPMAGSDVSVKTPQPFQRFCQERARVPVRESQPLTEEKVKDDAVIELVPPEGMLHLGYSWVNDGDNVKILAPALKDLEVLKDIQVLESLEPSGVEVQFGHKQLRILLRPAGGAVFGLMIRLYERIVPNESKFRLSAAKRLTVTLRKAAPGAWPQLTE
jgi:hypothetical protein